MDVAIEIVKILIGLTCVFAVGLSIYKIIKEYKHYKTITQKIVFWIMIIAYFFPILIFYIDYYNMLHNNSLFDQNEVFWNQLDYYLKFL